jgi:cobalt/nickel transport system permease protein
MHAPDGFIDLTTSMATGAVAVGVVALSLRGARRELDERTAPMAGLVAAFIFAVQMINFPVGAGTSGHLMGGALAAVLVGPWTGVLAVTCVLVVQALLFSDGGLTALGTNTSTMALATVLVGYLVFRAVAACLPRRPSSIVVASFLGALVSVPAAAAVFVGLYAVGGTTPVALGTVLSAMLGVHVLIGIGEAVITALTVSTVLAARPDLVHGARRLLPAAKLDIRPSPLAAGR